MDDSNPQPMDPRAPADAQAPPTGPLSPEERLLLAGFEQGEPGSFHTLIRRHLPSLLALARRWTGDPHWSEDLVQETLVAAFRGLPSFRGDSSLRTWLFRIQLRLAGQPQRWRKRERAAPLEGVSVPARMDLEPERASLERELRDRIEEAMERLPQRQRAALHLRAVEGLNYADIGQALECSAGAARMLVLSARRSVRDRLGEYLEP